MPDAAGVWIAAAGAAGRAGSGGAESAAGIDAPPSVGSRRGRPAARTRTSGESSMGAPGAGSCPASPGTLQSVSGRIVCGADAIFGATGSSAASGGGIAGASSSATAGSGSRGGSRISLKSMDAGSPPTVWWLLMTADSPAPDSMTSG